VKPGERLDRDGTCGLGAGHRLHQRHLDQGIDEAAGPYGGRMQRSPPDRVDLDHRFNRDDPSLGAEHYQVRP